MKTEVLAARCDPERQGHECTDARQAKADHLDPEAQSVPARRLAKRVEQELVDERDGAEKDPRRRERRVQRPQLHETHACGRHVRRQLGDVVQRRQRSNDKRQDDARQRGRDHDQEHFLAGRPSVALCTCRAVHLYSNHGRSRMELSLARFVPSKPLRMAVPFSPSHTRKS